MDNSPSSRTYRQRKHTPTDLDKQIDWIAIAPDVAVRLKGEPRTKSDTEWQWGNKGQTIRTRCPDMIAYRTRHVKEKTGNLRTSVTNKEGNYNGKKKERQCCEGVDRY